MDSWLYRTKAMNYLRLTEESNSITEALELYALYEENMQKYWELKKKKEKRLEDKTE